MSLKEHEAMTMTNLDLLEQTELRGHVTQLDHLRRNIVLKFCKCIRFSSNGVQDF